MNKSGTFRQLESNLRRTLFLCVAVLFLAAPARAQEVNGGAPQMPEETPLTTSKPAAFSGFGTGTVTVTSGHCAGLTGTNCWSFSAPFKGTGIGTGTLTGAINNVTSTISTGTNGAGLQPGGGGAKFTASNGDTITFELQGFDGYLSQEEWFLGYAVTGGTGRFAGASGGGIFTFAGPSTTFGTTTASFIMNGALAK
jgi:hypothetical protein